MSEPENATSGRYFLRSGKPQQTSSTSSTLLSPSPELVPPSSYVLVTPASSPLIPVIPSSVPVAPLLDQAVFVYHEESDSSDSSESDSDEMANTLVPSAFTGRSEDDIVEFLKNFDLWATFRTMTQAQKLSALPLLLKEGSAMWFNTQSRRTREDFEVLREALIQRYGPNSTTAWKRSADLWTLKQASQQSVDDFLTTVQQAAGKLGIAIEQTFLVALNGLRAHIRQLVLQHDPTTIEEIQKWGRLAELSQEDRGDTADNLRQTVLELSAIREELKQLQLTNVAAISANRRSSSPSPRHVTFTDQSIPPSSSETRHDVYASSSSPQDHRQTQFYASRRSDNRDNQDNQGYTVQQSRPPRLDQPADTQYRSSVNQGRPQQSFYGRTPSKSICGNCGGSHSVTGFCRGKGVTCFSCGKRGHLRSVCRSARGRYSNQR